MDNTEYEGFTAFICDEPCKSGVVIHCNTVKQLILKPYSHSW